MRDVEGLVAFLLAVAVEQVQAKVSRVVLGADLFVDEHGDDGLLIRLGGVVGLVEGLGFGGLVLVLDGLVRLVVEDHVGGAIRAADVGGHEPEAFLLSFSYSVT